LIGVDRRQTLKNGPHSFEELSWFGRDELIRGYFRKGTCQIKYDFIDYWFNSLALPELHKEFLRDRIP
jgi:hypothetical protein